MEGFDGLPSAAEPDDTTGADVAPFDQVEALARQLCRAAGGNWDAKRHKRGHWLAKARALLAAERPAPARELTNATVWLFLLCGGLIALAAMGLAP